MKAPKALQKIRRRIALGAQRNRKAKIRQDLTVGEVEEICKLLGISWGLFEKYGIEEIRDVLGQLNQPSTPALVRIAELCLDNPDEFDIRRDFDEQKRHEFVAFAAMAVLINEQVKMGGTDHEKLFEIEL